MEEITQLFDRHFNVGQKYTAGEIKEILYANPTPYENPAAFTYNRWNKGMHAGPFTFFQWNVQGNYTYLGANANFKGFVYHFPQGGKEYVIAEWVDGEPFFIEDGIDNFNDWQEKGGNGILIATVNSKVITKTNLGHEFKIYLHDNERGEQQMRNGYAPLNIQSVMGKHLIGKPVGHTFKFGPMNYEIISLE